MPHNVEIRELSQTEIEDVSGGVHLGGIINEIVQHLWSRSLS